MIPMSCCKNVNWNIHVWNLQIHRAHFGYGPGHWEGGGGGGVTMDYSILRLCPSSSPALTRVMVYAAMNLTISDIFPSPIITTCLQYHNDALYICMNDGYLYILSLYFIFYWWQFHKEMSFAKINVQIIHLKDNSFSQQRPIGLPSLHFILDSFPWKLILYNPSVVASVAGFSGSGSLASGWHCSCQK